MEKKKINMEKFVFPRLYCPYNFNNKKIAPCSRVVFLKYVQVMFTALYFSYLLFLM